MTNLFRNSLTNRIIDSENFEFLVIFLVSKLRILTVNPSKIEVSKRNKSISQQFQNGFGSSNFDTVAKYTNRITDSENFEFLVIFAARIPHFVSQSVQIQGK